MQRLMLPPLLLGERLLFFEIWATGAGELGQPLFWSRTAQRRGQPRTAAAHGHAGPREGPRVSRPPGGCPPSGTPSHPPNPQGSSPQAGYPSSRPWLPIIPGGQLRLTNSCPLRASAPSTPKSPTFSRHAAESPQSPPALSSSPKGTFWKARGGHPPRGRPQIFWRCPCKLPLPSPPVAEGAVFAPNGKRRGAARPQHVPPAEARKQRNRKHMTWACCLLRVRGTHSATTERRRKRAAPQGPNAAWGTGMSSPPRHGMATALPRHHSRAGTAWIQRGSCPGEPPSCPAPHSPPESCSQADSECPPPTVRANTLSLGLESRSREAPWACGPV